MTIAEVGKKYDITSDTLRYYERIGLLTKVPRNSNGIRNDRSRKEKRFYRISLIYLLNIVKLVYNYQVIKKF